MESRSEPGGVCRVSLLVPHPRRTAVLVAQRPPPPAQLPTVVIDHPEPTVTAVLASVDHIVPATAVVLRQVVTSQTDEGETQVLVELEAGFLRETGALGLVVGALYQVQTYRSLLPELPRRGADAGLAGADLDWINRSLMRLERGVESPV